MLQGIEKRLAGIPGVDVSREGGRLMVSGSEVYPGLCLTMPSEPVNGALLTLFGGIISDRRLERASPTALYALKQAGLEIARGLGDRLYVVRPARGRRPEAVFSLSLLPPKVTIFEANGGWPEYAPE